LYKAAVRLYTKPLFSSRKALSTSADDRTLYDFARRGLRNLHRIHLELASQRFAFRPGLAVHHNFNGKERTLYIYPWEERLVDLLLYRLLNHRLNHWFSPRSYAYRLHGWGVDRCQWQVARFIRQANGSAYVVKRDITDYFGAVDHELLLAQLRTLAAPDDYLFELLQQRVCFRCHDEGGLRTAERGIPFGTAIACFFANLYLTELDRRLAEIPGLVYFRYADDLLAASTGRDAALEAIRVIDSEMSALKLTSKPSHELDLVISPEPEDDPQFRWRSHFRHLGLEFCADGVVRLSRDKGRKIRNLFRFALRRGKSRFRRLKTPRARARLAVSLAQDVLTQGVRNVAIIDYYLKHVQDEEQWRRIDRWLAEEVLFRAFGKGHRKGHFRRMSFKELRAMGLPSLVHRGRLIRHGHVASPFFVWKNQQERTRSGRTAARSGPGLRPGLPAFSSSPEAAVEKSL